MTAVVVAGAGAVLGEVDVVEDVEVVDEELDVDDDEDDELEELELDVDAATPMVVTMLGASRCGYSLVDMRGVIRRKPVS